MLECSYSGLARGGGEVFHNITHLQVKGRTQETIRKHREAEWGLMRVRSQKDAG